MRGRAGPERRIVGEESREAKPNENEKATKKLAWCLQAEYDRRIAERDFFVWESSEHRLDLNFKVYGKKWPIQ